LYEQIYDLLLDCLKRGEWKPGSMIPSEVELAERYQVSQGTVRKAIDAMVHENLLRRQQGRGTFVVSHEDMRSKLRFLRLTAASGQKEILDHRLISCERKKVDAEMSALTGLTRGTRMIAIQRVLLFANAPVIFDDIVLEAKHFRGLNASQIEAHHGSLYSLYASEYGISMVRADERISAVPATAEQSERLAITAGYPLLKIVRTSYTYGDEPREWRLGYCVTANHHYANQLD
jgi:GntR family transcriptional regulator